MMTMIRLLSYLFSINVDVSNIRTQIKGNKFFLSNQPNDLGFHV